MRSSGKPLRIGHSNFNVAARGLRLVFRVQTTTRFPDSIEESLLAVLFLPLALNHMGRACWHCLGHGFEGLRFLLGFRIVADCCCQHVQEGLRRELFNGHDPGKK